MIKNGGADVHVEYLGFPGSFFFSCLIPWNVQISPRRIPYDYGSLMHYHAVAHAVRVSDFTIVPKELKYVTTMGTEKMAFLDAKLINDIYCRSMSLLLLRICIPYY